MKKKNRRAFLKELGFGSGFIALGKNLSDAFPGGLFPGGQPQMKVQKTKIVAETIDYRYAPSSWQSTYCFPDDPYKSLVGKTGELLYGHPGLGADLDAFAHRVFVGVKNSGKGSYVEQKLETPAVPIITTRLQLPECQVQLVSFATNGESEGRVDNLLIELVPREGSRELFPLITIESKDKFKAENLDDSGFARMQIGAVDLEGSKPGPFMVIDSPVELESKEGLQYCYLKSEPASMRQPVRFFARFPQEGQTAERIKGGLKEPERLLAEARAFWQAWQPVSGKVVWRLNDHHQEFLTACARNILQSREIKNGKKLFQVGPTVYRGLWFIDGAFLLEAARYLGYDKEAQEGLDAMWDRQNDEGAFFAGAGQYHWKDTAAALYSLARQADLAQNWDMVQELWTDAFKAITFLKEIRDKALRNGTPNGNYRLMPEGFGDSGIGGVRPEFTNTLWALIGLKEILSVARRLNLPKRDELSLFYGQLLMSFTDAAEAEMREHRNGFKYLPMLMKADPAWSNPDKRKRPQPQVAQRYLSHAIHPGLILHRDSALVPGHIELMKAVAEEDIPAETGWLAHDAVWTYNAPMVAQVYLWARMPELARKTFAGFLNHASPLYAWREEQSLLASHLNEYIGDMPHNWASAECVRFLRHMLVMEDESRLRLLEGIVAEDLLAKKPLSISNSPTRWGRVSLSFEPVDEKTWIARFKRENFDRKMMPKLEYVEFSRWLPLKFQLDKVVGASSGEAELGRILVNGGVTKWEATFRIIE